LTSVLGGAVRLSDLDYALPPELVARHPLERREDARLLVLAGDDLAHRLVTDLPELIAPGALLVVNDTRVLPARLLGHKASGGKLELFLVRRLEQLPGAERWSALGRSSRRLTRGAVVLFGGRLRARVEASADEQGLLRLLLDAPGGESVAALLDEIGHVPLPPYLGRDDEPADRERYQTVYARVPGAVAAPTAGLHFSEPLLRDLEERGVELARVTLHVGPGTFRPVKVDDLDQHPMHSEPFEVPVETARAIEAARRRGAPVIAVGTTVVRALETAADPERSGAVRALAGETNLLIQPGYRFAVVDALLTNFHLPRSTLLALVHAFAGGARVREAYREAVAQRYRFYSYGDAMYLASCVAPALDRPGRG
jgi:S-adenosylmethionine:tRNA ribosyltransferase-isomerase